MNEQQEREAFRCMPNPSQTDLDDPLFEAIWQVIKSWDVNVPAHYAGYCGANGSHVMLILSQLRAALAASTAAEALERAHNAGFVEASRIHGCEIEGLKAALAANVPACLIDAARKVVREALDSVAVHPCDENNDTVRARGLIGPVSELHAVMLAAPAPEADALEKAHEARRQAQAEAARLKGDILKVASAVTNAGLTLVKTADGFEVRKFGPAQAQQSAEPLAWLKHHPGALKPTTVPGCTFLAEDALAMGWEPLGRMTTTKAEPEAQQSSEAETFSEDQWWYAELDGIAKTPDQRRAMAVVRNLMRQFAAKAKPEAQQPIGQLFQHGETGRTRVVMQGDVADCDARWSKVGDLFLAKPELLTNGMTMAQFALSELYEFQQATGCDTADEYLAEKAKLEASK